MEIRIAAVVMAFGLLALATLAWRRPPRRLGRMSLAHLGIREPAIVQFTSPTCGPCRTSAPTLRETAEGVEIPFLQIDVGERPEVARALGVRRVPTIAVTGHGGEVVGVWTAVDGGIAEAARRVAAAR